MVRSARTSPRIVALRGAAYAAILYAGVYLEFGVPVFLALVIHAMFTCGTSDRWAGDASAYSVFNDGERIAGTMAAEDIDAQMRNGGHAPRKQPAYESSFVQNALRGWGGGVGSSSSKSAAPRAAPASEEELRRRRAAAADAAQARAERSRVEQE
jgi:hypothetical protein